MLVLTHPPQHHNQQLFQDAADKIETNLSVCDSFHLLLDFPAIDDDTVDAPLLLPFNSLLNDSKSNMKRPFRSTTTRVLFISLPRFVVLVTWVC